MRLQGLTPRGMMLMQRDRGREQLMRKLNIHLVYGVLQVD